MTSAPFLLLVLVLAQPARLFELLALQLQCPAFLLALRFPILAPQTVLGALLLLLLDELLDLPVEPLVLARQELGASDERQAHHPGRGLEGQQQRGAQSAFTQSTRLDQWRDTSFQNAKPMSATSSRRPTCCTISRVRSDRGERFTPSTQ